MSTNARIFFLRSKYPTADQTFEQQLQTKSSAKPVGCLAIRLTADKSKIHWQYSAVNPADAFKREVARSLSVGRLAMKPNVITLMTGPDSALSMHEITKRVLTDLTTSGGVPTKVAKSAAAWLSANCK